MECDKSLLDGINIVVSSSRCLSSLEQSLGHGLIRHLKVEDVLAWSNGLLKLLTLSNLTGISINEESLGSTELLDHGLSQQIKNSGKRDKLARLHDGSQVLASLRTRSNFLSQKIS